MANRSHGSPIVVLNNGVSKALRRAAVEKSKDHTYFESWIQKLVDEFPHCLPIDEIEPGLTENFVSVCMELPTKHGPIDNLLMTPAGDIALVETKLWRNPEARREVVAQSLDYASCLFEMDYDELEKAALKGDFGDRKKPATLYDVFEGLEPKLEPDFIDAVNNNLRKGRILIIVAGDGIRSQTERLVDSLQSHAGFHFTFALVELAVFDLPDGSGRIVHPRTLVQTEFIERGIVHIDDQRATVLPPEISGKRESTQKSNISSEQFFEDIAKRGAEIPIKLKKFLNQLDALGVYPEYLGSLNLKYDPPSGKTINFGYIKRTGQVWTDAHMWGDPENIDLNELYQEELAHAVGGTVDKESLQSWHVRISDKAPRIEQFVDHFDQWQVVIEKFLKRLKSRLVEKD